MSYYGEREYDSEKQLIGIGGRYIKDLNTIHRQVIAGMQAALEGLDAVQADYECEDGERMIDRLYGEIAEEVIEECKEHIELLICEHIVSFTDAENA